MASEASGARSPRMSNFITVKNIRSPRVYPRHKILYFRGLALWKIQRVELQNSRTPEERSKS
jgi:hypothetical protein